MIDDTNLQHFILGVITALPYPVFKRFKYLCLALILVHPFFIEGVQLFIPDRTSDVADIVVGLFGVSFGFLLVSVADIVVGLIRVSFGFCLVEIRRLFHVEGGVRKSPAM